MNARDRHGGGSGSNAASDRRNVRLTLSIVIEIKAEPARCRSYNPPPRL